MSGLMVQAFKDGDDFVEYAKALAAKLHAGQIRENGQPYITHPEQVFKAADYVLLDSSFKETGLAACWLHDTIEDVKGIIVDGNAKGKKTLASLLKKAGRKGKHTCTIVDRVTHLKGRYIDYMDGIFRIRKKTEELDRLTILIKIIDRISNHDPKEMINTSSALKEYKAIYDGSKSDKDRLYQDLFDFYTKRKVDKLMVQTKQRFAPDALDAALKVKFRQKQEAMAIDNLSLYLPKAEDSLIVQHIDEEDKLLNQERLRDILKLGYHRSLVTVSKKNPDFVNIMAKIGYNKNNTSIAGYNSICREILDDSNAMRTIMPNVPIFL